MCLVVWSQTLFLTQKFFGTQTFFGPNLFGPKIFSDQKRFLRKKITDSTFFQTHNVFRPNVIYDAKKINQNWYLMKLMHLRMKFDFGPTCFYLGLCLRATFNSDISEKLRPPLNFRSSQIEIGTLLFSFWPNGGPH